MPLFPLLWWDGFISPILLNNKTHRQPASFRGNASF
jgi:hypothetical protein